MSGDDYGHPERPHVPAYARRKRRKGPNFSAWAIALIGIAGGAAGIVYFGDKLKVSAPPAAVVEQGATARRAVAGVKETPRTISDLIVEENADYASSGRWVRTDVLLAIAEGDYGEPCPEVVYRFFRWTRLTMIDGRVTEYQSYDRMFASGDRMLFIQKDGLAQVVQFEPRGLRLLAVRTPDGRYLTRVDAFQAKLLPRCR